MVSAETETRQFRPKPKPKLGFRCITSSDRAERRSERVQNCTAFTHSLMVSNKLQNIQNRICFRLLSKHNVWHRNYYVCIFISLGFFGKLQENFFVTFSLVTERGSSLWTRKVEKFPTVSVIYKPASSTVTMIQSSSLCSLQNSLQRSLTLAKYVRGSKPHIAL